MPKLLKFTNVPSFKQIVIPKPIRPKVRSMSDESVWVPLPDDTSLLSKHLEKIKISMTK